MVKLITLLTSLCLGISFISCSYDEGENPSAQYVNNEPSLVIEDVEDLPYCTGEREGMVAVDTRENVYVCSKTYWVAKGQKGSVSKKSAAKSVKCTSSSSTCLYDSRDDTYYRIGKIGDAVWMLEDLKYWTADALRSDDCPKGDDCGYYYFFQDILYSFDWDSRDFYGICPEDFHVPTKTDWANLLHNLKPNDSYDGSISKSIKNWNNDTFLLTYSGFMEDNLSSAQSFGEKSSYYWIDNGSGSNYENEAISFSFDGSNLYTGLITFQSTEALTIRCVKDE